MTQMLCQNYKNNTTEIIIYNSNLNTWSRGSWFCHYIQFNWLYDDGLKSNYLSHFYLIVSNSYSRTASKKNITRKYAILYSMFFLESMYYFNIFFFFVIFCIAMRYVPALKHNETSVPLFWNNYSFDHQLHRLRKVYPMKILNSR